MIMTGGPEVKNIVYNSELFKAFKRKGFEVWELFVNFFPDCFIQHSTKLSPPTHHPAFFYHMTSTKQGRWSLTHASLESTESNQPQPFKLLLMMPHRAVYNFQRIEPPALFHILHSFLWLAMVAPQMTKALIWIQIRDLPVLWHQEYLTAAPLKSWGCWLLMWVHVIYKYRQTHLQSASPLNNSCISFAFLI